MNARKPQTQHPAPSNPAWDAKDQAQLERLEAGLSQIRALKAKYAD